METFLAIDGNSILNRAYYGIKNLKNSQEMPTNAVYGFLNMVAKIIKETNPDYITVAFDLKGPTIRHKKYANYKANRKGMPEELAVQLPYSKKLVELLGITITESQGYEGDDILGTISRLCAENNVKCIVASGDRDCFQLVNENTIVKYASNKNPKDYDETSIYDEFGLNPKQLIDVKALMGDSSDNIPGVEGIGQKSAYDLIKKYDNIDNIFKGNIEFDNKRYKRILTTQKAKDEAYLSKELGTINCSAPIQEDFKEYQQKDIDEQKLLDFFESLEFKQADKRISFMLKNKKNPVLIESTTIKDPDIKLIKQKLDKQKKIVFTWTDTLLIFIGEDVYEFTKDTQQLFESAILNSSKEKWTNNLKEMHHRANKIGRDLENVDASAEISGYLLDVSSRSYSLEDLKIKYCKQEKLPRCFIKLMENMENKIKEQNMEFLKTQIELPLAKVLADMEQIGFLVDKKGLKNWGDEYRKKIDDLHESIMDMAGKNFNLNSPKEVSMILFDKLALPPGKKTKTGYSTDASVLESLIKHHPIAKNIIEYRTYTKLRSTYVEGLIKNISTDGRVHTVFKQTETRTGRLSSTEPNLQNIPVRTEFSREFRKFFIAKDGYVLIDADYSQIELRILASLSKDKKMTDAFKNNLDIHLITASEVFGMDPLFVPPELRRRAKIINFSIIYGAGAYSLSQDINVGIKEADDYINKYFETYSGVKQYLDKIENDAKASGYVTTMFGRRRNIKEFKSKNYSMREFAKRAAKNTVIQGSAADIIKIAMIKVHSRLKKEKLDAKLILTVHDELLIESKKEDAERASVVLKQEMETATDLDVPLIADVSLGENWYNAKS